MLLEQIQQTNDIKKINPKDYPLLAEEIRQFLICLLYTSDAADEL